MGIKSFYLPDLGEKIKEATVKQWHVKIGDQVEEFQAVADVATDKLFTTIPSNFTGKVHKIFHQEEEMCQVGELFLEIDVQEDEDDQQVNTLTNIKDNSKQSKSQNQSSSGSESESEQVTKIQCQLQQNQKSALSSPAVRHLIKQEGLDINKIKPTGKNNIITKEDVMNFIKQQQQTSTSAQDNKQQMNKQESKQQNSKQDNKQQEQYSREEQQQNISKKVQIVKMSEYEKGMVKSMERALKIPHFYLMEEIDLSEVREMRNAVKKESGVNISYMPFLIKSFSLSLKEFGIINSIYDESNRFEYEMMEDHNISIAIDSPQGLVVPNIKRVQDLSIMQIQQEMTRLRDLAQLGKLSAKELFHGSVCISNIGNIGGTYTGPIILPPQVCIVAIGKSQELPRYNQHNQLVSRLITTVSFGCDHRVLNGATVTRFAQRWKRYLEQPSTLIMNMT